MSNYKIVDFGKPSILKANAELEEEGDEQALPAEYFQRGDFVPQGFNVKRGLDFTAKTNAIKSSVCVSGLFASDESFQNTINNLNTIASLSGQSSSSKKRTVQGSGIDRSSVVNSSICGSGIKRSGVKETAPGIFYYRDPQDLVKRLELLLASKAAGNNSIQLVNECSSIIDILLNNGIISRKEHKKIFNSLFG